MSSPGTALHTHAHKQRNKAPSTAPPPRPPLLNASAATPSPSSSPSPAAAVPRSPPPSPLLILVPSNHQPPAVSHTQPRSRLATAISIRLKTSRHHPSHDALPPPARPAAVLVSGSFRRPAAPSATGALRESNVPPAPPHTDTLNAKQPTAPAGCQPRSSGLPTSEEAGHRPPTIASLPSPHHHLRPHPAPHLPARHSQATHARPRRLPHRVLARQQVNVPHPHLARNVSPFSPRPADELRSARHQASRNLS